MGRPERRACTTPRRSSRRSRRARWWSTISTRTSAAARIRSWRFCSRRIPKLGFRDVTEEYPHLPGTSLASVFDDRGYRTAFVTPSDLSWAGWDAFLEGRGFGELRDYPPARLPAADLVLGRRRPLHGRRDDRLHRRRQPAAPSSSWGGRRRRIIRTSRRRACRCSTCSASRCPISTSSNRYLNVLHETDRHLGRLFDTVRRARTRPGHAHRRHRRSRAGVRLSAQHVHPGADDLRGRRARAADVLVAAAYKMAVRSKSDRRSGRPGADDRRARRRAAGAGLAGPQPVRHSAVRRARISTSPKITSRSGCARTTGSTSSPCAKASRSCTTSTAIRTSSTTSRQAEPVRTARMRQRLAAWTEANRRQYGTRGSFPQRASLAR